MVRWMRDQREKERAGTGEGHLKRSAPPGKALDLSTALASPHTHTASGPHRYTSIGKPAVPPMHFRAGTGCLDSTKIRICLLEASRTQASGDIAGSDLSWTVEAGRGKVACVARTVFGLVCKLIAFLFA